jgi:hypothetical protein
MSRGPRAPPPRRGRDRRRCRPRGCAGPGAPKRRHRLRQRLRAKIACHGRLPFPVAGAARCLRFTAAVARSFSRKCCRPRCGGQEFCRTCTNNTHRQDARAQRSRRHPNNWKIRKLLEISSRSACNRRALAGESRMYTYRVLIDAPCLGGTGLRIPAALASTVLSIPCPVLHVTRCRYGPPAPPFAERRPFLDEPRDTPSSRRAQGPRRRVNGAVGQFRQHPVGRIGRVERQHDEAPKLQVLRDEMARHRPPSETFEDHAVAQVEVVDAPALSAAGCADHRHERDQRSVGRGHHQPDLFGYITASSFRFG